VRKLEPTFIVDDVFVEESSSSESSLEWLQPTPSPSETDFGSESSGEESGCFFLDGFLSRSGFLASGVLALDFGAGFSVGYCFTGVDVSVLDPEALAAVDVVIVTVALRSRLTSCAFALPA
jgi:hypothetical protein